ncbi:hypothetical protein A2U01_0083454, partial [Trifolium medium]|nr:hypothetical protein [Trifolium medium]
MVSEQTCRGPEVVIIAQVDDAAVSESTTVSPVVLSQGAGVGKLAVSDSLPCQRKRNASCPPGGERPLMSGPW